MSESNENPCQPFPEARVEHIQGLMQTLLAATQPGAVFGSPVVAGNFTVITASEIASGGGFGFGGGAGPAPVPASGEQTASEGTHGEPRSVLASGSGGGGGGGSMGRPVAVIVIGPDCVRVKPVIDVTKLAIAALTFGAAAGFALRRLRKASKLASKLA